MGGAGPGGGRNSNAPVVSCSTPALGASTPHTPTPHTPATPVFVTSGRAEADLARFFRTGVNLGLDKGKVGEFLGEKDEFCLQVCRLSDFFVHFILYHIIFVFFIISYYICVSSCMTYYTMSDTKYGV